MVAGRIILFLYSNKVKIETLHLRKNVLLVWRLFIRVCASFLETTKKYKLYIIFFARNDSSFLVLWRTDFPAINTSYKGFIDMHIGDNEL